MKGNRYLQVSTKTWKTNPYGLFDFFAPGYFKAEFEISQNSSVCLDGNRCMLVSEKYESGINVLLGFGRIHEGFVGFAGNLKDGEKIWRVVESCKKIDGGYRVVEGDWIKMGKILMLVKKVYVRDIKDEFCLLKRFYDKQRSAERFHLDVMDKGEDVCRVCFSEFSSEENPLISPCKCSGSMRVIHLSCLQVWLKNKIISHVSPKVISFYKTDLICEICKEEFPFSFTMNNKELILVDFLIPNSSSFIIFEEYSFDRTQILALHVFSLNEGQQAVIGRGSGRELRFNDLSISRKHVKITFVGSDFYIKDKKSKYGTLVEMKDFFRMEGKMSVQVGRTVFKIAEKKVWDCRALCWRRVCRDKRAKVSISDENTHEIAEFIGRHSYNQ